MEIRRRSTVRASDGGEVGTVEGFVCDDSHHVTHLVLEHRRFFGHRDITIPIGQVDRLENDEVRLAMDANEIGKLPSVAVYPWSHRRSSP